MKELLLLVVFVASLYADGCWSVKEDANFGFSELNDKITFSFKDAVTCEPISYADVEFWGSILLQMHMVNLLFLSHQIIMRVMCQ